MRRMGPSQDRAQARDPTDRLEQTQADVNCLGGGLVKTRRRRAEAQLSCDVQLATHAEEIIV